MWSEPETQAVHEFSQRHDVTTLITMHNFASLVLRPPGRHNDGLAPDEAALKKLGDQMGRDTGYTSEYGFQLYDTSGTTEDWNYGAAGTFGYTIEMGPDQQHNGNFHIAYKDAVIDQWTGASRSTGRARACATRSWPRARGRPTATSSRPSGAARPRDGCCVVHKSFTTFSSNVCSVETTGVDCTDSTPRLGKRSRADFLDYTTIVPRSGRFSWIVTPSTRPFELKAGKTEQWTLTCENPTTHKVLEKRKITVDRGQTLPVALRCGAASGGGKGGAARAAAARARARRADDESAHGVRRDRRGDRPRARPDRLRVREDHAELQLQEQRHRGDAGLRCRRGGARDLPELPVHDHIGPEGRRHLGPRPSG